MTTDVPTPTLDKIADVQDKSQAIGAFLEWLARERRFVLAMHRDETEFVCDTCGIVPKEECSPRGGWHHRYPTCENASAVAVLEPGLYAQPTAITALLADYFEIDEEEAEKERRALLAAIRASRKDRP